MVARARSRAQKRKRAFNTRSQGIIRKVKDIHQFTDAKTAIVGIINGKMFWYDETDVLRQLGIAHEPQDELSAETLSCASSISSAEYASSLTTDSDSPGRSTIDGSPEPPEPELDASAPSCDDVSFLSEGESFSTTDTWASPDYASIASLDLDFFGLEEDNQYGI